MTNENNQINPTIEETENDTDVELMRELENKLKAIFGSNGSTDDEEYEEDSENLENMIDNMMKELVSELAVEAVGPELDHENVFFKTFRQSVGRMTALLLFGEEADAKKMLPDTMEFAELSRTIDLNRIANALEARAEMESTIATLVKDGALDIDFGQAVDGEIEVDLTIDMTSVLES